MHLKEITLFLCFLCLLGDQCAVRAQEKHDIRHSYLVMGAKTAIIDEEGGLAERGGFFCEPVAVLRSE